MPMIPGLTKISAEPKYLSVLLDSLRVDSVLDFDLYIRVDRNLVLYRSANLPFTDKTRQSLLENRVDRVYIVDANKDRYQKYIEKNLPKILTDPAIKEEKKASILYETSTELVKDVLANPTYGENIQRSKDLVANTMEFILKGREAFHNLLKLTSFDYYTYTHSVNVCTFAIALAQEIGLTEKAELHELGVGALLHDVGKSRISDRILNKRAPLNPTELEIMKRHPQMGVELLTKTDEIAQTSYYPVLQHHERGDRNGYPNGITLKEMHIFSQIVAICDTFDAMTTERVYQGAIDTFPALKIMFSMDNAFDEKLLKEFAKLMGPG